MKQLKTTLRAWQIEAEAQEIQYLADGGQKPLLAACPGAGKTLYGVNRACRFFNEERGELVIVIAPTVNIKLAWSDAFKDHGFTVVNDVQNSVIRDRITRGHSIKETAEVIIVTYDQLASPMATTKDGWSLFAEYCRRYQTLVIADEVHHADDQASYGIALKAVADEAARRLALSGTPFNSVGGVLAMCDTEHDVDERGRPVRRAVPFHVYSYGDALNDKAVCRTVEFGIVYGKAKVTYESLLNGETFERLIDLSRDRKDDSLQPLLDADGEFMATLLDEGIARLDALKRHHRNAAMLVVAMDHYHAGRIQEMLQDRCGNRHNIQLILHDTEKAHDRIHALEKDNTDIVVTVRMISEGIDVKRFRVGVYASDAKTRLFFVQFIGRFLRWQAELGDTQHAWVIFPGHVELVRFAQEIEQMILDSAMKFEGSGDGPPEPSSVRTRSETEFTGKRTMEHGRTLEDDDEEILASFFAENPDMRGKATDSVTTEILRRAHYGGVKTAAKEQAERKEFSQQYWRQQNAQTAKLVAKLSKRNGSSQPDDALYAAVNGAANRRVGIHKVDALVPIEILKARLAFLKTWAQQLMRGIDPGEFDV